MCHRLKFITDVTIPIAAAAVTIEDELIISLRNISDLFSDSRGGVLIALNGHHPVSASLLFLVFRTVAVFIILLLFPITAPRFGREIRRLLLVLPVLFLNPRSRRTVAIDISLELEHVLILPSE
jgi:hypothetical protein